MTHKALKQFFDERPAISKAMIAEEASISRRTLNYAIDDGVISKKTAEALLPVLQKYGWQSA